MSDTAHAKQGKNHSASSDTKAAESSTKAAVSAATATRVPAWANAWGDQPPTGLQLPVMSIVPGIQAKLAVSQPGDPDEREADQVAEQVMRMPAPVLSRQQAPISQQTNVQRKCSCGGVAGPDGECRECAAKRKTLQRRAIQHTSDATVPPAIGEVLSSGSGRPLDAETRAFMEPRFGRDFSHIRVHTSEEAVESARSINAQAYTVGSDVVFGAGQYQPHTQQGQSLLAHELTHTMQQASEPGYIARQVTSTATTLPPDQPLTSGDQPSSLQDKPRISGGELPPLQERPWIAGGEQPLLKAQTPNGPCQLNDVTNLALMPKGWNGAPTPTLVYQERSHLHTKAGATVDVIVQGTTGLPDDFDMSTPIAKALTIPGKSKIRYAVVGTLVDGTPTSMIGELEGDNISMVDLVKTGPDIIHSGLDMLQSGKTIEQVCQAAANSLPKAPEQTQPETQKAEQKQEPPRYPEQNEFEKLNPEEKSDLFWENLWKEFKKEFSWVKLGGAILAALGLIVAAVYVPLLFFFLAGVALGWMIANAVSDFIDRWKSGEHAQAILGLLKDLALMVALIAGVAAVATLIAGVAIIGGLSATALGVIALVAVGVALVIMGVMLLLDRNDAVNTNNGETFKRKVHDGAQTLDEGITTIITTIVTIIVGGIVGRTRLPIAERNIPPLEQKGITPPEGGGTIVEGEKSSTLDQPGKSGASGEGQPEGKGPQPKTAPRAVLPNGQTIPPDNYFGGYHGTGPNNTPEIVFRDGLPARGNNWSLLDHVLEKGDTAYRGLTPEASAPGDIESGAVYWADEGGYVYEIKDVPTWDVNKNLEGRVGGTGKFSGNPMHGENEHVTPARVPPNHIVRGGKVISRNGRLFVETWQNNPNYKPGHD